MKQSQFDHNFNRGDRVFHVTKLSPEGIVLDVAYSQRNGVTNLVTFGYNEQDWYKDEELSNEQRK